MTANDQTQLGKIFGQLPAICAARKPGNFYEVFPPAGGFVTFFCVKTKESKSC